MADSGKISPLKHVHMHNENAVVVLFSCLCTTWYVLPTCNSHKLLFGKFPTESLLLL